jgi:hypothetical protein
MNVIGTIIFSVLTLYWIMIYIAKTRARLGQSMVIDNRPGAGGNLALQAVARPCRRLYARPGRRIGIVDAADEALGEEAHRIHAQLDELAVDEDVRASELFPCDWDTLAEHSFTMRPLSASVQTLGTLAHAEAAPVHAEGVAGLIRCPPPYRSAEMTPNQQPYLLRRY